MTQILVQVIQENMRFGSMSGSYGEVDAVVAWETIGLIWRGVRSTLLEENQANQGAYDMCRRASPEIHIVRFRLISHNPGMNLPPNQNIHQYCAYFMRRRPRFLDYYTKVHEVS